MIRIFFVVYRRTVSPFLHFLAGPTGGCRFDPHCSEYSEEAIKRFGLIKGAWLSLSRIFSCHPWTRRPMHDPVPPVSNSVRPSGKV